MTRRGLVGRAVAAGAGAALADVPAVLASPERPAADPDPVLALIAEEARLRSIACEIEGRADAMLFALPEEERRLIDRDDEASISGPLGELYRQAAVYEEPAAALSTASSRRAPRRSPAPSRNLNSSSSTRRITSRSS
jgi:hypothetical protein